MSSQNSKRKPLMEKRNPFTPDMPVQPNLFAGREPEIGQINTSLSDAIYGMSKHILIQGERWIGKTSMARYVEALALMRKSEAGDRRTSYFVSFCSLGSCFSLEDLCTNIIDSFKSLQNTAKEKVFKILNSIQGLQIGPVGVTLNREPRGASFKVSEFSRIMEGILKNASEHYQSFLIIMDETEQVSRIAGVASLLKDMLEHLDRVGLRNLVTVMTATRECVDAFTSDHESL
jgi:Cdc6-like AAA superfamily ATPase